MFESRTRSSVSRAIGVYYNDVWLSRVRNETYIHDNRRSRHLLLAVTPRTSSNKPFSSSGESPRRTVRLTA